MWDFKKIKFDKKIILCAILFLFLAFLVVSVYVVKNRLFYFMSFRNPLNFDIQYDRLDVCENDSDCMLVDYKGCYKDKRPINKRYLKQYTREPYWQRDLDDCAMINNPWFVDGELKCRLVSDGAKRCTTQIDVAEKVDLQKCLEKYDFISPDEKCSENCETEKNLYVVRVGGGGIHEEVMAKSSYKMYEYEGLFPADIENKVIAVYDERQCEPCEKKFFIRENIGLNEVDVYRFCYYLEQQNAICGDCGRVEKISR